MRLHLVTRCNRGASAARAICPAGGVTVLALVTTTILLALPVTAFAYTGKLKLTCQVNQFQRAKVDPLEDYGVSPSAHLHTPAGAEAFSSTSTVAKVLAAPTSCESRADHSMIWMPTPMTAAGRPARITSFTYYLINLRHDVRRAPPTGLRFVGGDPHCSGQFCAAIYGCVRRDGTVLARHTIPTRTDGCDTRNGSGYEMAIFSPGQCWDGRSLGPGMGNSTEPAHIFWARRCPGPVIPEIMLSVSVGANGLGGYLSVTSRQRRAGVHLDRLGTLTSCSGGRTLPCRAGR